LLLAVHDANYKFLIFTKCKACDRFFYQVILTIKRHAVKYHNRFLIKEFSSDSQPVVCAIVNNLHPFRRLLHWIRAPISGNCSFKSPIAAFMWSFDNHEVLVMSSICERRKLPFIAVNSGYIWIIYRNIHGQAFACFTYNADVWQFQCSFPSL
jgi:hypothetical protein